MQSLHIKTSTSTALPIYNTTLDDAGLFSGPTAEDVAGKERALAAKAVLQAERDEKLRLKEVRRLERSATASGKGREEKKAGKRKASELDAEDAVVVEEVSLDLSAPIVDTDAEAQVEPAPKVKKSKKSKDVPAVVEEAPVAVEAESPRPAKKTRSADAAPKKVKADGESKKSKRTKA